MESTVAVQSIATKLTDVELYNRYLAGDETAFGELYSRYRAGVIGYVWRMVGRQDVAEDICTETFLKVLDGAYKPPASFRSFVFTVAHRRAIDRLRNRQRRDNLLRMFGWPARGDDVTPEGALLRREGRSHVDEALQTLPAEHRATVLLFYGQDLSSREVAEAMGCTDQQVRSRLAYARRRLREILEGSSS